MKLTVSLNSGLSREEGKVEEMEKKAWVSLRTVICRLAGEAHLWRQEVCQQVFVYHARGNCQSW